MKVGNVNPINFRGTRVVSVPEEKLPQRPQIKELNSVTPDFAVRTPQKYKKLGVTDFSNGLKLHSYKLANGYRVSVIPMENSPTMVKNYVNVGSLNETDNIKGISHFLEHMAFNGTTGENGYMKLNQGDSFLKIDKMGGWINASTSYAVTDYVNSTPMLEEKDLEEQIKIIAAMTEDLAITPQMIEKEKGPVCSEINMILDRPETILLDQTVRTLFGINSSADELIAGSTRHITNLTRDDVKSYYDRYYTPDNMNLVITGNVDPEQVIEIVAKNFHSNKKVTQARYEEPLLPINKTVRKDIIFDKALSTNIMLGFVGPKNNDSKDKVITEILEQYLTFSELGLRKELKNINCSRGFYSEKISANQNASQMLCFGLECAEENSEKALKIVYDKLSKLKAPSQKQLEIIKKNLITASNNSYEVSSTVNNLVGNAILDNSIDYALDYENILNSITTEDIQNYIDKYLDFNKTAITVVHPQTTIEEIEQNHKAASVLSFKGAKLPINKDIVDERTLENNFKTVFFDTNNKNVMCQINFSYPRIDEVNPALSLVLDFILTMGSMHADEDAFNKFKQDNCLTISGFDEDTVYGVSFSSDIENFEKAFEKSKELLYEPRITEENVQKAKENLKDIFSRMEDDAYGLYASYESKSNPLHVSKEQILEGLDSVTLDDVKSLHKYIIDNSQAVVVMNNPANSGIKQLALEKFSTLKKVNPYEYKQEFVYKDNLNTKVLTKEKPVSQADITQVFKFESSNDPKERVMRSILRTILTSSSIGLFNTLREKEHLAYSVHAQSDLLGNSGEFSCNILTTTDNKETQEFSYDNVQKSINGFNRQISCLLNSEYSEDDLESAKKILKANLLLNERTSSKAGSLLSGLYTPNGVLHENEMYEIIDKITRADIDEFSKKVFKNPPIYAIVASKDTLDANKEFFESLENSRQASF